VLVRQVDGIFCTDGSINYSPTLDAFVYVYFYRNEYLGLDTNLNLVFRGKTIDTTSVAKIKVTRLHDRITMSAPPLVVNRISQVAGDELFVCSEHRATNEFESHWKELSVIDVYNIRDQSYKYSFYVPDFDNHRMESFLVHDDYLVAQFHTNFLLFRLNKVSKY
jgi:hypothetical protein